MRGGDRRRGSLLPDGRSRGFFRRRRRDLHGLGGGLRYDLSGPAHPAQLVTGVVVTRVDLDQLGQPLLRDLQPAAALADFGQGLQGDDVLGIEFQGLAERRFGLRVLLQIEAAAAQNDVAGDVIGVALQPDAEHLERPLVLAVLAVKLGQGSKRGPLGILLPAALELFDVPAVRHRGP